MLINKFLMMGLLKFDGSQLQSVLKFLKSREYQPRESNEKIQKKLLKKLLIHCYENVPYYRDVLVESGVMVGNEVDLTKFSNIPVLTKEIIREHFEDLKSNDMDKRKWYPNTSGGSTGEPVKFLQDKVSWDHGMAGKWFFSTFAGKDICDKEIKLWGSERDILKGSIGFKAKIQNMVFNRVLLNSFRMSESDMREYVNTINKKKPVLIEAYVQSIYELSKFIKNNNLEIYSPRGVITSAGTLYPGYQQLIEEVFGTKVYNRYGSREVGDMACSCEKGEGLHLNLFHQYIEILNDNGEPCKPGEIGQVYVTTLNNYVMPLIRYQIGDMAIPAKNEQCSCGRGLPLIERVIGRVGSMIKTKKGVFDSTALTTAFYFFESIKEYQVVQKSVDHIAVNIVPTTDELWGQEKKLIEKKLKMILGEDVFFDFCIVDSIEPTESGKYLYFLSEVE